MAHDIAVAFTVVISEIIQQLSQRSKYRKVKKMNLNKEKLNKAYRTLAAFAKTSSSGFNGKKIIMKTAAGELS